ncbi:hypothetical protein F4824DRAFT_392100 [Ustulina deusta]|nr:hypothetical protein F4824DRAFT_392100 [Ustulina deusta]
MLRGLNSIYLQAPHVRQAKDIADLLFLTQSWSSWLLNHHHLKEAIMLPGFEAALGVPAGTFTLLGIRSPSPTSPTSDRDITPTTTTATTKGKGKDRGGEAEDTISSRLRHVYAYASTTRPDPQAYNATTLQGLLANLAETLVPHLTRQVGLLASMREMCLSSVSPAAASIGRDDEMPAPLPVPMAQITKTASASSASNGSPSSPPSTSSTSRSPSTASSPPHSPRRVSFSLFPSTSSTTTTTATTRPPQHGKTGSKGTTTTTTNNNNNNNNTKAKKNNNNKGKNNVQPPPDGGNHTGARIMEVMETDAKDRLAHARALLEADDRANRLTQVHTAAEAHAAADVDYFVIPPMIVRLRDSTVPTTTSLPSGLSRTSSSSSIRAGSTETGMGMGMGRGGAGVGAGAGQGNNKGGDWPRLSVPAVHAIADKLSLRHEGAWRFLPCDVWGRPRELPFSAE